MAKRAAKAGGWAERGRGEWFGACRIGVLYKVVCRAVFSEWILRLIVNVARQRVVSGRAMSTPAGPPGVAPPEQVRSNSDRGGPFAFLPPRPQPFLRLPTTSMSKFPTTWHALMTDFLAVPTASTRAARWKAHDEALLRTVHSQARSWEEIHREYNDQAMVRRTVEEIEAKAEAVKYCESASAAGCEVERHSRCRLSLSSTERKTQLRRTPSKVPTVYILPAQ